MTWPFIACFASREAAFAKRFAAHGSAALALNEFIRSGANRFGPACWARP